MSAQPNRVTAVIFNPDEQLRREIGAAVESAGFHVVTAAPADIGTDTASIQRFLREHAARVVIYDIRPPLLGSWLTLNDLRYAEMISGSWRQFIVTTTDRAALERDTGATGVVEAAEGRLDRAALSEALQRAIMV